MLLSLALSCTSPEPTPPLEQEESASEGHWTKLDTLAFGHADHTATMLPGQQIIVLGGFSDKVERVDVPARRIRAASPLPQARMNHAAAALPDGRLIVAGGEVYDRDTRERTATNTVLIWDPETDTWSDGPALSTVRVDFTLSPYGDGVIAIGGKDGEGAVLGRTAVLAAGAWLEGPAVSPRHGHDVDAWRGGLVITGGRDGDPVGLVEHIVEGRTKLLATLSPPRADQVTLVLDDDSLMVIGGDDGTDVLADVDQLVDGQWVALTPLSHPRSQHGAGQVADGRVVVFGGRPVVASPDALPIRDVEIYEADGAWREANRQVQARYEGVTLPLEDGRVLVAGGNSRGKVILEVSVYSPEPKPPRVKQPEDTAPPEPAEPSEPSERPPAPPGLPPGI